MSGGHAEDHGLDESGNLIDVSPHRHNVELNLLRYEVGLSRSMNDTWDIALRVPYFVKEQSAGTVFPSGTPAANREPAQRNSRIRRIRLQGQ